VGAGAAGERRGCSGKSHSDEKFPIFGRGLRPYSPPRFYRLWFPRRAWLASGGDDPLVADPRPRSSAAAADAAAAGVADVAPAPAPGAPLDPSCLSSRRSLKTKPM
jgi:hypothetical protein